MFNFNDPDTFWLNVTNIALAVVTLICCAVVARSVYQEIRVRLRKRAHAFAVDDDHAFIVPELGLTMADGGERVDRPNVSGKTAAPPHDDEPNIIRAEN